MFELCDFFSSNCIETAMAHIPPYRIIDDSLWPGSREGFRLHTHKRVPIKENAGVRELSFAP